MKRIEKVRDRRVRRLARDPWALLRPTPPPTNRDLVRRMRLAEARRDEARRALREAQSEASTLRCKVEEQARDLRRKEEALEAKERALRQREHAVEAQTPQAPDATAPETVEQTSTARTGLPGANQKRMTWRWSRDTDGRRIIELVSDPDV